MAAHPYLAFLLVLIGTFILAACGPYADETRTALTAKPPRATLEQGAKAPGIDDPPMYIGDKFEEVQRQLTHRGAVPAPDAPTF